MGYGSGFPFAWGGGRSGEEQTHQALRLAMGNIPGPVGGIEDLWRRAEAVVIEKANRLIEHAIMQAFPRLATTGIPQWEVLHGLPGDGYDEERRIAIEEALVDESLADYPSLEEELQAKVSAKLTLVPPDRTLSRVQQIGRIFGAWGSTDPALEHALFSDQSIWRVQYQLSPGDTSIPLAIRKAVDALMQDRLPAWETHMLIDDCPNGGFLMDGGPNHNSLMDQTPAQ